MHGNVRHGFVYERVPHITLKSIANNAEIDVIWDKWQLTLEPLREKLNTALKQSWEEWQIPRDVDAKWSDAANALHADWWRARIARQTEIDASIAAKAEFEYLYDKPYEDRKRVRVAGPFTVESLSPHRALTVGADDELIDHVAERESAYEAKQTFPQMILDNLSKAGVQQVRISLIPITCFGPSRSVVSLHVDHLVRSMPIRGDVGRRTRVSQWVSRWNRAWRGGGGSRR